MNKKDLIYVVGTLVGGLIAYRLIMWLINDVQIDPMWLTLIIVYVVLVYPQYNALYGLKLVSYDSEGEDTYGVKPNKRNLLLFANDWDLIQYFGFESIWKKAVAFLLGLSIPVMIFSILYVNLLVVFMDLGATFTVYMMYAMLISMAVYVVTKTIIVMYFINMFSGIVSTLIGLVYPFGLFVLTSAVKQYFNDRESVAIDDAMGANYD